MYKKAAFSLYRSTYSPATSITNQHSKNSASIQRNYLTRVKKRHFASPNMREFIIYCCKLSLKANEPFWKQHHHLHLCKKKRTQHYCAANRYNHIKKRLNRHFYTSEYDTVLIFKLCITHEAFYCFGKLVLHDMFERSLSLIMTGSFWE